MVNTSKTKYNVTSPEEYTGLFRQVNEFTGGSVGIGLILIVWMISFFSLQNYRNIDALKSSTFIAWLLSLFMTLMNVTKPAFSFLLLIALLAMTAYSSKGRR